MNETTLLISIIIFLILGFGILIFILMKKLTALSEASSVKGDSLSYLQNQLFQVNQSLDTKLSQTNQIIQEQLQLSSQRLQTQNASHNDLIQKINDNNARILKEVTEKLVHVEDTNRQVVDFAKGLHSLESILKNPKQRGILGEYFLETILSNVLPQSIFQMQYSFSTGIIVDAAIFSKDKIIPIDAKFSLESYNRIIECQDANQIEVYEKNFLNDVKKRIDEASKYVRPEENTIDIAFMFVPADGVYHEIIKLSNELQDKDIISYAYSKKVVIVSPTSFFAYLQTVLQAMNMVQVEQQVHQIVKYLNESTRYLKAFEEHMDKLGKNIQTLTNTYHHTSDEARKLSDRISKITNNKQNLISLDRINE